jgi:hypothetical protein
LSSTDSVDHALTVAAEQGAARRADIAAQAAALPADVVAVGAGVLVAMNVNFDGLSSMSNGEVASLVTKAEGSGWYLEIEQVSGDPELSFGVHVGGSYHAATWDGGGVLNDTAAFFIVGCYDGNGKVRLLVNGELVASSSNTLSGGVSTNASPIVVGANWQTGGSFIRFMEFQVQSLMVQNWIE